MNAIFIILYAFNHLRHTTLFCDLSTKRHRKARARSREMLSRKSVDMNKKNICYGTFNGKIVAKLVSDNERDDYERRPEAFFGVAEISGKNETI